MRFKFNFKLIIFSIVTLSLSVMALSLAGCGETVEFFLKNQSANSGTSSSAGPSVYAPTVWTDHTNNPFFGGPTSGNNRAYYPFVIHDGSVFHIWYGDGVRTRHATSAISNFSDVSYPFTEITVGGTAISTALGNPYHPFVLYNATGWTVNGATTTNAFLMYTCPGTTWDRVYTLTSPDGIDWTNLGTNNGVLWSPNQAGVIYNFAVIWEGGSVWKGYSENGGS